MNELGPDDVRTIGRYRLIAELGAGGMGRVLLGVSRDGRLVAVKQVHPGMADDPDFRVRFRREVVASRSVSGAYTAAVMDADPDATVPWLASVFVPGPSLDAAVTRTGPLPAPSIRVLGAGLAAALAEIHRAGLVHRDLKPSNVLLADDGPRVIDFGVVRPRETGTRVTQAGYVVGSPGFMSPEQVDGRALTPASDMFSLGSVLAFAASGREPFGEGPVSQLMYKVALTEPDLRSVPVPLRAIVEPCLAKNPADRPTPDDLLDLIGQVNPGQGWLPYAVTELITEQKAKVSALLGVEPAEAQGPSGASETVLRPAGVPLPAPPPARNTPPEQPAARAAPVPSVRTPPDPPRTPVSPPPVPARPAAGPVTPGHQISGRAQPAPAYPAQAGNRPAMLAGGAIGVVLLIGIVIAVVVSQVDGPPTLPPVSYAGMPGECRDIPRAQLETLRTPSPNDDVPSGRNETDNARRYGCNWAGPGVESLAVTVTEQLPAEGLDSPIQRARGVYDSVRGSLDGATTDEGIGDRTTTSVVERESSLSVRLVAQSRTTVLDMRFADFSAEPVTPSAEVLGAMRQIARRVLENTP